MISFLSVFYKLCVIRMFTDFDTKLLHTKYNTPKETYLFENNGMFPRGKLRKLQLRCGCCRSRKSFSTHKKNFNLQQ